jgi:hypothetical protein
MTSLCVYLFTQNPSFKYSAQTHPAMKRTFNPTTNHLHHKQPLAQSFVSSNHPNPNHKLFAIPISCPRPAHVSHQIMDAMLAQLTALQAEVDAQGLVVKDVKERNEDPAEAVTKLLALKAQKSELLTTAIAEQNAAIAAADQAAVDALTAQLASLQAMLPPPAAKKKKSSGKKELSPEEQAAAKAKAAAKAEEKERKKAERKAKRAAATDAAAKDGTAGM